ncbi:mannosyltransferase putative-domain-containing protein, partial [Filobasidium floriforme]|uniref:mannosyltransferase putative-domain-containing protein n=1 Tax=Filobasidium floriforme TaxID=5210 RepID=UPI001E8E4BF4
LDTRLEEWINVPIPSAEDMARQGEALCPTGLGGRNETSFHVDQQAYWSSVTTGDIKRARQDLVDWLRAAHKRGEFVIWPETRTKQKKTRGMIMTGGNGRTMRRVALTLDLVRNVYHNQIPVEIFSFADELIDERDKAMIERFGKISFKTVSVGRFDIKGRAFLRNSFDEFLYIDSDSIPLQNISQYFDAVEYASQGSVFWPDIYKDHSANAIWRIIGEPCGGDWAQETGQVLFDRTGNFGWNQAVLLLADRMQTQGDFWYHFSYGDKDTWRYAFKILGLPTPTSGRSYSPLGGYLDRNGTRQEQFCGHTMLQHPVALLSNSAADMVISVRTQLKYHDSHKGRVDVFSQLQRLPVDALTEPSLERLSYVFDWEARCLSIE